MDINGEMEKWRNGENMCLVKSNTLSFKSNANIQIQHRYRLIEDHASRFTSRLSLLVQLFDTFSDQLFCRDIFVPQIVDLELNFTCELIERLLRVGQEIGVSTADFELILNVTGSFNESEEGIKGYLSELTDGRTHVNVRELICELLNILKISINMAS